MKEPNASKTSLKLTSPGASGSGFVKVESMDGDDIEEGGGDETPNPNSKRISPESLHYWNDKAPILGNCCEFSTLGCTKFWAILNFVQLLPAWILTCGFLPGIGKLASNDDNTDHGAALDSLSKCLSGTEEDVRIVKLVIQIFLMLTYTCASVLFVAAVFPPHENVLPYLELFCKIFLYSLPTLLATCIVPIFFHASIRACYELISIMVWIAIFFLLFAYLIYLLYTWQVVRTFQKYLKEKAEIRQKGEKMSGTRNGSTSATPRPSEEDMKVLGESQSEMSESTRI